MYRNSITGRVTTVDSAIRSLLNDEDDCLNILADQLFLDEMLCGECDAQGRGDELKEVEYSSAMVVMKDVRAIESVDRAGVVKWCSDRGLVGSAIGDKIRAAEIDAIRGIK